MKYFSHNSGRILFGIILIVCAGVISIVLFYPYIAGSGTYLSTVHGNSTLRTSPSSGVDRSVVTGSSYPDVSGTYPKGHCSHCHDMHASVGGSEPTPPASEGATSYSLFRSTFGASKNELCYACHEKFSFTGQMSGYGRYGVYRGKTIYNASDHYLDPDMVWSPNPIPPGPSINDAGNCINCHDPHGYTDGAGGALPSLLFMRIDDTYTNRTLCDRCHDGTHNTKNVYILFNKAYKHPTYTISGKHSPTENISPNNIYNSGVYRGTNRHSECVDCHNPHAAAGNDRLKGVSGVNITNPTTQFVDLTSSNYTFTVDVSTPVTQPNGTTIYLDYKLCFKCHSNWAYGAETNAPNPTPSATWQQTNIAKEFNVNNYSYHYVEGDKTTAVALPTDGTGCSKWGPLAGSTQIPRASTTYGNFNTTYIGIMEPSLSDATNAQIRTAKLRCSSCHGMDGASSSQPEGPHGSAYAFLLKVPSGSTYNRWDSTVTYRNNSATIWCFNCHDPGFTNTGFSGGMQNLHTRRHDNRPCQNCHIAIPHGWKRYRLLKFSDCDTLPYNNTGTTGLRSGLTWKTSGNWQGNDCHNAGVSGCG